MAYVVSPVDSTTPLDTDDQSLGAQEFRLLKAYIQTNIIPVINAYANPAASNASAILVGYRQYI